MKNKKFTWLFLLLILVNVSAQAVTPTPTPFNEDVTISNMVMNAINASSGNLFDTALIWIGSFMALQFVITQIGLLKSGAEIEAIFGKLIGSLMWFSFCIYILYKGPDFIDGVGHQILNDFAPNLPGPGAVITATMALVAPLLIAATLAGAPIIGDTVLGMLILYVTLFILATGMFFAVKIFMLELELGLIVMLAPLSFSFLGLNALKDQGIAPFKSLISLLYRIILFGLVFSAYTEITGVAARMLNGLTFSSSLNPIIILKTISSVWKLVQILPTMVCSYIMLGYLLYKSDSIAASLASGSTSMGTGDVASAVGGAVAGAMAGTAAVTAASGGKSMGDVMKNMMGGGSVSNATPGSGSGPVGQPPANPANMSTGGGSFGGASDASGGGAPKQETEAPAGPSPAETAAGGGAGNTQVSPQQSLGTQTAAGQVSNDGQEIVDSLNSMPGGGAPKQPDTSPTPAQTAAGGGNAGSGATAGIGGAVFDSVTAAGGAPEAALAAQSAANAGKSSADVAQAAMKATPGGNFPLGGSAHKQMTDAVTKGMTPQQSLDTQTAAGGKAGSGATAGIGGAGSPLEKQLGDLVQALSQPKDAAKPSFTDRMGALNQHVAQEKAATHVSINTHNAD